jgi:hypothetical protein
MARWYVIPVAAAAIAASGLSSLAADMPVKAAADMPVKAVDSASGDRGNLYSGIDGDSQHSLVGYVGLLYAPFGTLSQSGVRISAFGLYGKYRYDNDSDNQIKGLFWDGDLLVGYSKVTSNGAYTLSIGANYQDHHLSPDDPANSVNGSKTGFKVQGDFYVNPTSNTMLFGLASYSTAFSTYYSILRAGYDFTGREVFFGPEVGAQGNERYDQYRIGGHVSGIKVGSAKLTISAGYLNDRTEGSGLYGAANIDFPF